MTKKKSSSHTKKRKSGIGMAKNQEAAASLLCVDVDTIRLARAEGGPGFKSNGNIDCDTLLGWLAEHPGIAEKASGGIDAKLERALWIRAKRLFEEHQLALARGEVVDRADLRRDWFRHILACKHRIYAAEGLINAECAMRLSLSNEQASTMRGVVMRHLRFAIRELHGGQFTDVVCPNCGVEIKDKDEPQKENYGKPKTQNDPTTQKNNL